MAATDNAAEQVAHIAEKIRAIACRVYGADDVSFAPAASKEMAHIF